MSGCIFCSIVTGDAPASLVHEDDRCLAFLDLHPLHEGHLLVVPRVHAAHLADLDPQVGGHLSATSTSNLHALPRYDRDGFGFRYGRRIVAAPRDGLDAVAARVRGATR